MKVPEAQQTKHAWIVPAVQQTQQGQFQPCSKHNMHG